MTDTNDEIKYNFNDKVVIVTGSNSGIGAEIATQFAKYGAKLTITGREEVTLKTVAEKIQNESKQLPLMIIGDLLDETFAVKLINETIEKYGRLDILVNNAGGGSPYDSLFNENLMTAFDNVYGINVRSIVQLTQLSIPHLERTKGNIINISSIASLRPHSILYSSSKSAVDMITKASAQELGSKGIRVNSINPGPVITRFGRSLDMPETILFDSIDDIKQRTILGFVPVPVEIAKVALFLASNDARNITGSIIVCDTGSMVLKPF